MNCLPSGYLPSVCACESFSWSQISQAEYAGSIPVIRSISPGRRLAGPVTSAILVHHSVETGCSPGSPMTESNDSSR